MILVTCLAYAAVLTTAACAPPATPPAEAPPAAAPAAAPPDAPAPVPTQPANAANPANPGNPQLALEERVMQAVRWISAHPDIDPEPIERARDVHASLTVILSDEDASDDVLSYAVAVLMKYEWTEDSRTAIAQRLVRAEKMPKPFMRQRVMTRGLEMVAPICRAADSTRSSSIEAEPVLVAMARSDERIPGELLRFAADTGEGSGEKKTPAVRGPPTERDIYVARRLALSTLNRVSELASDPKAVALPGGRTRRYVNCYSTGKVSFRRRRPAC